MGLGPMVGKFAGWRRYRRGWPHGLFNGLGNILWQEAGYTVGLTAETGDWRGAGLFTQIRAAPNYLHGSWRA